MITLDQAKELVSLLEGGDRDGANQLLTSVVENNQEALFKEVGKLTRQLHDSITDFRVDNRLSELAASDMPDARDRLSYVLDKTEAAANKTMDAVERTLPMADKLQESLQQVRPQWNALMNGKIALEEFKALCHRIDALLTEVEGDSVELHSELTEILMAQDFQDLTGQVIRRVIELVQEVETQLVEILKAFGSEQSPEEIAAKPAESHEPEGPIIHPELRDDVAQSQDEVDDLLSSLGF